jgi:ATP-dependent DNA ligase
MLEPKPMLASECEPGFQNRIWQLKYDGCRGLLGNLSGTVKLINRRDTNKIGNYPEFKSIVLPEGTVLDGEVVHLVNRYQTDFYKILSRDLIQNQFGRSLLMKTIPATFVAFDILFYRGEDLRAKPLSERLQILVHNFKEAANFRVIESFTEEEQINKLIADFKLEGKVIKKADSQYIGGRSSLWIKDKVKVIEVFEVAGYKSHHRTIAALLLKKDGVIRGYTNFILNEPEWLRTFKPLELGIRTDHENKPYMALSGLEAEVRYCPSDKIKLLREPVMLRMFRNSG